MTLANAKQIKQLKEANSLQIETHNKEIADLESQHALQI